MMLRNTTGGICGLRSLMENAAKFSVSHLICFQWPEASGQILMLEGMEGSLLCWAVLWFVD